MAGSNFKKLLVPIDFTETSLRALDYAIDMAKTLGASITVMHARPIPIFDLPDGGFIPSPHQATILTQAAQDQLDGVVRDRKDRGVELQSVLRSGDARDEIPAVADEVQADLVIMGTHGRGPIGRALLGSVAPVVIRTVRQPVLMIPGPR